MAPHGAFILALSLIMLAVATGWAPAGSLVLDPTIDRSAAVTMPDVAPRVAEIALSAPVADPAPAPVVPVAEVAPAAAAPVGPAAPAVSAIAEAVPSPEAAEAAAAVAEPLTDYALYLPSNAGGRGPLRILVALHGMGGNGSDFAQPVLSYAERLGWAVLAPTMPYRDYRDPELVRRDGELHPRLKALLDALPARTGLSFQPKVVLFGFSRGSQEAQRFSLMYPQATLGVAGMSGGSYTLPSKTLNAGAETLNYPFGASDVDKICGQAFNSEAARQVQYWIAVGGADNRSEDVPRQWDRFLGKDRIERAQRIVAALQQSGAKATLTVFPGAGHEVTEQMRQGALDFLASLG